MAASADSAVKASRVRGWGTPASASAAVVNSLSAHVEAVA